MMTRKLLAAMAGCFVLCMSAHGAVWRQPTSTRALLQATPSPTNRHLTALTIQAICHTQFGGGSINMFDGNALYKTFSFPASTLATQTVHGKPTLRSRLLLASTSH